MTTAKAVGRPFVIIPVFLETNLLCLRKSMERLTLQFKRICAGTAIDILLTASAISIALKVLSLNSFLEETLTVYLNDWENRSFKILENLSDDQLDLGTSLFLIDSLLDTIDIKGWVDKNINK